MGRPVVTNTGAGGSYQIDMSHQEVERLLEELEEVGDHDKGGGGGGGHAASGGSTHQPPHPGQVMAHHEALQAHYYILIEKKDPHPGSLEP